MGKCKLVHMSNGFFKWMEEADMLKSRQDMIHAWRKEERPCKLVKHMGGVKVDKLALH